MNGMANGKTNLQACQQTSTTGCNFHTLSRTNCQLQVTQLSLHTEIE